MSATAAQITAPGTVFTFVESLTHINPRWTNRVPGAHLISMGASESGWTVGVINTMTGRRDDITIEPWWLAKVRIIPAADPASEAA
jgi:hypothetical protein